MTGSHEVDGSIPFSSTNDLKGLIISAPFLLPFYGFFEYYNYYYVQHQVMI